MEMRFWVRRVIVIALMIFACFLLQTTIFPRFEIAGVVPNVLIIITSFFGFTVGRKHGCIVGFACGIILDLFNSSLFGLYSLIFLVIGYVNGVFRKIFFGDDMKLPLLFVGVSDLIYGMAVYFALFFFRHKLDLGFYFMNIMMPEMVYTICVMIPLYFVFEAVIRRLDQTDNKRSTRKIG